MRRRSLPLAGKSPQAWDSVNRHTPCDFKVATRDTRYGHILCCSGTGAARARAPRAAEGLITMNYKRRPDRAAAIVAVLSMLMQPTAHVFAARRARVSRRRSQLRPPPRRRPLHRRSRSQSRRPRRRDASRWRLAAHVQPAERGQHPRLSAADLELGEADTPRGLQRRLLSQPRPATSPRSARSRSRRTRRSPSPERLVSFQQMKIVEANFQTLQKEQVREITADDRQGDSRRRTGDCARSRPRQSGQEPDRAEERRGHQGRSPDRSSSARRRR